MRIPKTIHYCWLSGDPFPADIQKCIDSWQKYMPDYKMKLWDTTNFDINICQYTAQAMEKKKYAFVSDYVRLYALYHEGGIYLDSDIEVFQSFDSLLENQAFTGFESGGRVGAWLMASEKGNPLFREMLDYYTDRNFYDSQGHMDLTPNTVPVTRILVDHGLQPKNTCQIIDGITVYPEEYFCPKNPWNGEINITKNTYAVHLFKGAWNDFAERDLRFINHIREYVWQFVLWIKKQGYESRTVTIYGIGTVGRIVLEQLRMNGIQVKSILVSKLDNGWKKIDDIPIYEVGETDIEIGQMVLVATTPQYHSDIEKTLVELGVKTYFFLGKEAEV